MAFYALPVSNYTPRFDGRDQFGARARFFDAGTNTPRVMYADGLLTTPLDPNNILSDANAQFPPIWGQGGPYKAEIKTGAGEIIRVIDNLPGDVVVSGGGGGSGGGGTSHETGDLQASILSGTRTGWVRANGRTIGSAASGALELADDTAEALFLALWPNTIFEVSGGRGASAAADWAANKPITLPDARLCALIGADGMGNSATNLFASLPFTIGNAATVGSKVGASQISLSAGQNGPHNHSGSTSIDGSHAHTGVTGSAGGHSHTGSTSIDGNHVHSASVNATGTTLFVAAGGGNVPQAGSTTIFTSTEGNHFHSIVTTFEGAHVHGFTTDAAGGHGHTFATAFSGSGTPHANVQPSLLTTIYIRL